MDLRTRPAAVILSALFGCIAVGGAVGVAVAAGDQGPRTAQADAVIDIAAFDIGFDPDAITVNAPGTYRIVLQNEGALPHDLTVDGGPTVGVEPGEISSEIEVDVPDGGITFYCSIEGHRDAGMEGRIRVAGSSTSVATFAIEGIDPDPGAPLIQTVDPEAPGAPGEEGTVDATLRIVEAPLTVADGYAVLAWTFDGSVPGPVIRARVGDTVRAQVINDGANGSAHGIDFAAASGSQGHVEDLGPGDEAVAVFQVEHAGVFLYGAAGPSGVGVANGLYGMIIVEPAGGMAPADVEFALVQGEWYVSGQGQAADPARVGAAAPAPDLVTFNGIADQYLADPLRAFSGDRVRFFLAAAGPSLASAFAVQGLIFDRVTSEGVELLPGNPSDWGSGTVGLLPGQGAIAEAVVPDGGDYGFVSRILNQAGRGAAGTLSAEQ